MTSTSIPTHAARAGGTGRPGEARATAASFPVMVPDELHGSADPLLEESTHLRARRAARRELLAEAASGGLFLAAAGALAAAGGVAHAAAGRIALLVGLYALFSRIRFPVGAGYVFPTFVVLVPMLLLVPPPAVPLLVATGLLIAAVAGWARTRLQPERILFAVSDGWHALGPALVLTIAHSWGFHVTDARVLALALAASCLVDMVTGVLREAAALDIAPRLQISAAARACVADVCLAPIGLLAALAASHAVARLLLLVPLGALLLLVARDRDSHIAQAQRRLELVRRERSRLQSAVRRMGDALAARLDLGAVVDIVLRGSLEALDADGGRLMVVTGARTHALEVVPDQKVEAALATAEDTLSRQGVDCDGVWAAALPISFPDGRGRICIARRGRAFQEDELALLAELALRAGKAAADIVSHERTRRDALTDPLTGLANRRKLSADLEQRFAAATAGRPSLLIVFDLDGFKPYNDTFGHQAGDALLARLGHKLADAARDAGGHAYRLGGDEFCLVMDVDPDELDQHLAEAAAALTESGEQFSITASWGVVVLPHEADNPDQALQRADERMYAQKQGRSSGAREQLSDVLMRTMRAKNPALEGHSGEVALLSKAVARRLGLDGEALDEIARAAELHDLGKVGIPDALLDKAGALSEEEWAFMYQHTILGERILNAAPALRPVARIVRSTHERWDGAGYPDGLSGEDILLGARIVAVCDAYDAMTSDRSYRRALPHAVAVQELETAAGTQFDPTVVAACLAELASGPAERSEPDRPLGVVGEISAHVRELLGRPSA
jgi:diguanylate cyclase (GGDEF)-like protein